MNDVITVEVGTQQDCARLEVAGEIDASTSATLAEAIDGAWAPGVRRIEIDAAAVTFIDSAGLRVLVAAQRAAEESGRRLTVVNASASTKRLLEITGLSEYLLA